MNYRDAVEWLDAKLDEAREAAKAAKTGWTRTDLRAKVREKYVGTHTWLEVHALVSSYAIDALMLRILQRKGRAKMESRIQMVLELGLRDSYVISEQGDEQSTWIMTGDEARAAIRELDRSIAEDTASRNRLQLAVDRFPTWVGERTLEEAVGDDPREAA